MLNLKKMSNKILKKKYQSCGDVTIYDHANSYKQVNRSKKSDLVNREIFFDVDKNFENVENFEVQKNRSTKVKNIENINDTDHNYIDHHVDIWFLISEHIQPENIGNFALICKKTSFVVKSAKFWFFLYRKYYNPFELPVCLQQESIKLEGLRTCVIRSLFYTYKPFSQKDVFSSDFHCVVKKQCISMWYQNQKGIWNFYFKFKKKIITGSRCTQVQRTNDNLEQLFNQIYNNQEEHTQILVITTDRFHPLEKFYAKIIYLSSIAQGFNKLELIFSDYCNHEIGSIAFNPVTNIKVLNWWNPAYYSHTQY